MNHGLADKHHVHSADGLTFKWPECNFQHRPKISTEKSLLFLQWTQLILLSFQSSAGNPHTCQAVQPRFRTPQM
jgi:hypothetical protein